MRKESVFDELLILKIKEGDTKAFELLVKRWNKKLLAFTVKYIKDSETSKDIVQESWTSIYKGISKLKESSKFSTWAFRITYNKIMDHLRQAMKQKEVIDNIDIEEENGDTEGEIDIGKLLETLPATQKMILVLFYLEGQSIKQISEITGTPQGSVKSKLFYAREKLKKTINKNNYENFRRTN